MNFSNGKFRRLTSKSMKRKKTVYVTVKRSCLLRLRRRLIVRGSSGIAPFATALDAKNAGCHTSTLLFSVVDLSIIGLGQPAVPAEV